MDKRKKPSANGRGKSRPKGGKKVSQSQKKRAGPKKERAAGLRRGNVASPRSPVPLKPSRSISDRSKKGKGNPRQPKTLTPAQKALRTKLRKRSAASPLFKAAERERQAKALERRTRYALGRGLPLPVVTSKHDTKIVERFAAEYRKKHPKSYAETRRKTVRKFKLRSWKHPRWHESQVYALPFVFDPPAGSAVDPDAVNAVYAIEQLQSSEKNPRLLRAFVEVVFKDEADDGDDDVEETDDGESFVLESVGVPMPRSYRADDPDSAVLMVNDINAYLAKYVVESIERVEIEAYYRPISD
jgi:hypothetical protein